MPRGIDRKADRSRHSSPNSDFSPASARNEYTKTGNSYNVEQMTMDFEQATLDRKSRRGGQPARQIPKKKAGMKEPYIEEPPKRKEPYIEEPPEHPSNNNRRDTANASRATAGQSTYHKCDFRSESYASHHNFRSTGDIAQRFTPVFPPIPTAVGWQQMNAHGASGRNSGDLGGTGRVYRSTHTPVVDVRNQTIDPANVTGFPPPAGDIPSVSHARAPAYDPYGKR